MLDSWAVLAWLGGESSAAEVADLVDGGGAVVTWVNLGEVAYILHRRLGAEPARNAVDQVQRRVLSAVAADRDLALAAASIKATHPLAFADAFAAAAATLLDVPLATGDPELLRAERGWRVLDLRGG